MDILEAKDDLFEQKLRNVFLQLSAPSHIREEIATSANLHNVDNVLCIFKLLVESYDIWMPDFLEDLVLLNHLFVRVLVAHECFVDRL